MATLKYKNGSTWSAIPAATNAALGTPTVSAPGTGVGTPTVSVSVSGANTAKVFSFSFTNLRGTAGGTGGTGAQGPMGTIRGYGQLYATATKSIYRSGSEPASWSTQRVLLNVGMCGLCEQRGLSQPTISYTNYSIRVVTPSGSSQYLTLSFSLGYQNADEGSVDYIWAGAAQTNSYAPTSSSTINCYNKAWCGPIRSAADQLVSAPALYTQAASSTWYYQLYARHTANGTATAPLSTADGTWLLVKDFGIS